MQPDDFDPFAGSALTHTAPVTPEQEEIWLSIQLGGTPASLAYNQPIAFELRGALDVPALRHALDRLIERHEALRITLSPDGATLCVAEKIAMPFTEERLAPGDASDTRARAELACRRVTAEPFDLVLGPLVRAHLVTIGEQEHVLVIVSHHLVCDGWSLGVIGKELGQLYSAERTQKPAALDEAVPFSTYAAQRTGDEQVAAERTARAYWLSLFKELPAPLDLPLDGPRPAERTFAADRIDFTLPAKLVTDLKAVSTKSGVSIVVMLLGAFQVLLHRLTSQRAIAIAMPVAGQSVTGQHALVGHCVRALPVLAQIDPEMPFAQHLLSVRRSLLDAIEHSDVSFGGVIKDLGVPRDPSRVPLAPVMFNVDQDSTIPELAGLEVRVESPARASENFEIFVNARLLPKDEILLETMFKTDLFSRRTVELRLVEYRTLLESIVQNPSEKIGDLELMSVEEKQRVLVDLNRTQAEVPPETVCGLFLKTAARYPDRAAVMSSTRTLTYGELDRASAALATEIRAAGIGAGHLVGVSLSRSVDLLVGLLGILRAGAAYVPLDPEYPAERLELIATDAGLTGLVTERALAEDLPSASGKRFVIEDARPAASDPQIDASKPTAAAYVIYTSGSTGKPKGVVIEHRNVSNFLMTMAKEPGIAIDDVLVAITTPSFDISVLELFLPLTVGAKVVIATREQVTQGEHLAQLLNESRATIMQATPSGWRLLLEASWAGKPDLVALTGGEALSTELAASLLSRTRTLWNCYGPTETTVWSMLERVASVTDGITIGRPIANTTLYVLDARLRPVVPGATGELYIGGLGVTRGYWKRPELDLERFVKDPFARELPNSETARMYKTGDLVRMRWDGRLEWLGRSDFQVKVRGHRIELPEIEARLSAIPGILEAVAIVREDRPNDQRIVAYVRAAGAAPAEDALRENLRACLPGYMVPQHIVTLDAFPQTPNGKIDRKALPPPNVVATAVRLPETATEVRLATEIGELLGVPQVGLDSDFFSLGGHSLLAQRLTVRVRSLWGVEMPMRHVFASPTLKGLADFIDAASSARNAVPILSNIAGGETEEFVL